jgi:hypothetical protein
VKSGVELAEAVLGTRTIIIIAAARQQRWDKEETRKDTEDARETSLVQDVMQLNMSTTYGFSVDH